MCASNVKYKVTTCLSSQNHLTTNIITTSTRDNISTCYASLPSLSVVPYLTSLPQTHLNAVQPSKTFAQATPPQRLLGGSHFTWTRMSSWSCPSGTGACYRMCKNARVTWTGSYVEIIAVRLAGHHGSRDAISLFIRAWRSQSNRRVTQGRSDDDSDQREEGPE